MKRLIVLVFVLVVFATNLLAQQEYSADLVSAQIFLDKEDYKSAYPLFLKVANAGNAIAQYNLGYLFRNGLGVKQNYTEAAKWYRKAAEQGDVDAQNIIGCFYEFGQGVPQDYKKAVEWYQKAAEQGDANAQYNLGFCYDKAHGVPQDYAKAFEWYQKAANQGLVNGQHKLGFFYHEGMGVTQDYTKAAEWFQKAADQGYELSQMYLGHMYRKGEGVSKNYTKAIEWYQKAAEQGDAEAQACLGDIYYLDQGFQDYAKAIEWYLKAAEQEHSGSQNNLGYMYYNGQGVPQDYSKAVEWYQKAANQGNTRAQVSVGHMYLNGYGVPQNYSKAIEWFVKAANQGQVDAFVNLGLVHENGLGVPKDNTKAFEWYQKAAEQGNVDAQEKLGHLYYSGQGVSQDIKKAEEWYTKAANQGNSNAMNSLGWCYYKGEGIAKDYKKAEKWFRKALETDEKSPYPYSNLALLYAQRDKNYTEALRYSDMAITRAENYNTYTQAAFYGERGLIYVWKEDMTNAEKMLAKCLELNPEYLSEEDDFAKLMAERSNIGVDNNIYITQQKNINTFAIIIGNEKYKNEVDVPYANNDARIFGEYVEKTLGVPHDQIRVVKNAGYNDLRISINWLMQAMEVCKGKGSAIVYYAGHGIPDEKDQSAYLLPTDGIGNDPESAYSLKDLYSKLGSVDTKSITIFLDACFSGAKREGGILASARGVAIKIKSSAPKGSIIAFTAAQGDETAYPYNDMKHGLFTYYLLKKLQESKGEVTLGELYDYLIEEVGRESFIKNGKKQTPTVIVSDNLREVWKSLKLK